MLSPGLQKQPPPQNESVPKICGLNYKCLQIKKRVCHLHNSVYKTTSCLHYTDPSQQQKEIGQNRPLVHTHCWDNRYQKPKPSKHASYLFVHLEELYYSAINLQSPVLYLCILIAIALDTATKLITPAHRPAHFSNETVCWVRLCAQCKQPPVDVICYDFH